MSRPFSACQQGTWPETLRESEAEAISSTVRDDMTDCLGQTDCWAGVVCFSLLSQ